MAFFSFFVTSWVGRVILVVGGIIVAGAAFVGVIVGLAVTGGPDDCKPGGGPIVVSQANSDAFQQKWDSFNATLDGGSPASVTFNESELSSRTKTWAEEEGLDFEDVLICIHNGFGEATGTLDMPGFLDTKVKIKGRVELTGEHPEADIDDIDIGNVPGPFIAPFENLAERAVDEALDRIDLDHAYTVTLSEGEARIDGQP